MKRLIPWIPLIALILVYKYESKNGSMKTRADLFPTDLEYYGSMVWQALVMAVPLLTLIFRR